MTRATIGNLLWEIYMAYLERHVSNINESVQARRRANQKPLKFMIAVAMSSSPNSASLSLQQSTRNTMLRLDQNMILTLRTIRGADDKLYTFHLADPKSIDKAIVQVKHYHP